MPVRAWEISHYIASSYNAQDSPLQLARNVYSTDNEKAWKDEEDIRMGIT